MTATITVRKGGTILVPKAVRDRLKVREGTRLKVSFTSVAEEEEVPVEIKRMPNGRRVIMGWDGFDAAKAVREARDAQVKRILSKSPKP